MLTEQEKVKALSLLNDMLSIPTVNSDDNTAVLAQYVAEYLKTAGIHASLHYIDGKNSNIVARIKGENAGSIVLCGHLDTVPYGNIDEWSTPPHEPVQVGDRVYCRGASDMKSGLAAMVFAIAQLSILGGKPESNIVFIGTADEEKSGKGAAEAVKRGLVQNAKALIIAEPTGCNIGLAQKGCLWLRLTVQGKTSHAAYLYEGISAVDWALKLSDSIKKFAGRYEDDLLGASTVAITGIHAGIANNMIPDHCEIILDIRTAPSITHEAVLKEVHSLIENMQSQHEGLAICLEVLNDRMPIHVSQENPVVQRFLQLAKTGTGRTSQPIGINFFTDASILTKDYPELPVILYGPGEQRMAHKPNEYVELKKYYEAIDAYRKICAGLTI